MGIKVAGLPRCNYAGVWVPRAEAGQAGLRMEAGTNGIYHGRRPGHHGQGINPAIPTPTRASGQVRKNRLAEDLPLQLPERRIRTPGRKVHDHWPKDGKLHSGPPQYCPERGRHEGTGFPWIWSGPWAEVSLESQGLLLHWCRGQVPRAGLGWQGGKCNMREGQ